MSRRLLILEGADGSGKTTFGQKYAQATGAHYVHLGPFPRVGAGLARYYVDAMMPAVLGLADVVMDRCWLSEVPYGAVHRAGLDRLGVRRRLLERLAARCETTVVHVQTDWGRTLEHFRARKGVELLERESQLRDVWLWYRNSIDTALPVTSYDPWEDRADLRQALGAVTAPHPRTWVGTAGFLTGNTLLVGEAFGEVQEGEPAYQWPFGALGAGGCSLWLAERLEEAKIPESRLLWVNADSPSFVHVIAHAFSRNMNVYALGRKAETAIRSQFFKELTSNIDAFNHPQHHKRFKTPEPYPLIDALLEFVP